VQTCALPICVLFLFLYSLSKQSSCLLMCITLLEDNPCSLLKDIISVRHRSISYNKELSTTTLLINSSPHNKRNMLKVQYVSKLYLKPVHIVPYFNKRKLPSSVRFYRALKGFD